MAERGSIFFISFSTYRAPGIDLSLIKPSSLSMASDFYKLRHMSPPFGVRYTNALLFLAQRTSSPAFRLAHESVRGFYSVSVPRIVEGYLNESLIKKRSRVRLRGSTLTPTNFNLALSDLDLEIIVPDEVTVERDRIREKLIFLKKVFPPLGEAEIYTQQEKMDYDRVFENVTALYSFLRKARKWVWMERALSSAETDYHRFKASRARNNCFSDLIGFSVGGPPACLASLSPVMVKQLKVYFPEFEEPILNPIKSGEVWNPYMGMSIAFTSNNQEALTEHTLELPDAFGLLLLAISPCYFPDETLSDAVSQLRRRPDILAAFKNLSKLELLIARAVRRALPEVIPLEWLDLLEKSVAVATPSKGDLL